MVDLSFDFDVNGVLIFDKVDRLNGHSKEIIVKNDNGNSLRLDHVEQMVTKVIEC